MNLEIKKRIDLIDNSDVIQLFFELLKDLIEKTNISNDDERIALNIRNDDKKRFSVNINSRLVLMINNEILAVMINDDDLHQISHLNNSQVNNFLYCSLYQRNKLSKSFQMYGI